MSARGRRRGPHPDVTVHVVHSDEPSIQELAEGWADGFRVGPNTMQEFHGWLTTSIEERRRRIVDVACKVDNSRIGAVLDTPVGPTIVLYQPPSPNPTPPNLPAGEKRADFSTAFWRFLDPPTERRDLRGRLDPVDVCIVACAQRGHHHVGVSGTTLHNAVAAYRSTGRKQRVVAPLYGKHIAR